MAENEKVETTDEEREMERNMALVGMMSSSVVHEIKNPVALIHGYAEQIKGGQLSEEKVVKMGEKIEKSALKILDIIKSVQTMVHEQTADKTSENVKSVVLDALEMVNAKVEKNNVKIDVDEIDESWTFMCRPVPMMQVISNLVSNSVDAMVENGIEEKWVKVEVRNHNGNIGIFVTDAGCIDEEVAKKVFKPLFTTKKKGKGTGLGLHLSKKIVEAHNGKLSIVPNSPNTKFVVLIPIEG